MRRAVRTFPLLLTVAVLAACTGDDEPALGTAEVTSDVVVETIAAAAELEPAAREPLAAPTSGEVAQLLVADGEPVEAGEALLRLDAPAAEEQLAQAEAAVAAVDEAAGAADAAGGGVDPTLVLTAFRQQLDAVFPPVLDGLRTQVRALEAGTEPPEALTALADPDGPLTAVTDPEVSLDDLVPDADVLPEVPELPQVGGSDPVRELRREVDAALTEAQRAATQLQDAAEQTATEVQRAARAALEQAEQARLEQLAAARTTLADAERSYTGARNALVEAEEQLAGQLAQATAGQQEALDAQREQAEQALELARQRSEALTLVAPVDGVVELARAAAVGAGPGGLGDLAGLGFDVGLGAFDLDAAGAGPDAIDAPDLGDGAGLGGAGLDGAGLGDGARPADVVDLDDAADEGDQVVAGPLTVGVEVTAGATLATVYDLSSFTARVAVDEIDVVHVEEGQAVVVLVDAYPDVELEGRVSAIAIAPERQAAGGTVFPVTVELVDVPDDVELRVGLTASAEIEVRRVDADTVVPTAALLRGADREVVYVVREGRAVAVAVDVLAIGDDVAAVDGDLEDGELVVTTGVELVEDGTEVPT